MTVDAAMTWVKKLCIFTKLHQSGQVRVVPLETDEVSERAVSARLKERGTARRAGVD